MFTDAQSDHYFAMFTDRLRKENGTTTMNQRMEKCLNEFLLKLETGTINRCLRKQAKRCSHCQKPMRECKKLRLPNTYGCIYRRTTKAQRPLTITVDPQRMENLSFVEKY